MSLDVFGTLSNQVLKVTTTAYYITTSVPKMFRDVNPCDIIFPSQGTSNSPHTVFVIFVDILPFDSPNLFRHGKKKRMQNCLAELPRNPCVRGTGEATVMVRLKTKAVRSPSGLAVLSLYWPMGPWAHGGSEESQDAKTFLSRH